MSAVIPAKRASPLQLVPPRRSGLQRLAERRLDPAFDAYYRTPITREMMVARLSPYALIVHNRLVQQWTGSYQFYIERNDGNNPLGYPPKLKVGMSMPEENEIEIICQFALYLALITEGPVGSEFACLSTVQQNVRTTFDVLRRVLCAVSQTTRRAVEGYITSDRFCKHTTLSTVARAKYYMSTDDAIILSRIISENTALFHTTRMRVQMHHALRLQNHDSEPQDTTLHAKRYKVLKNNKKTDFAVTEAPPSLCWSDYTFQLIPNPKTPSSPCLLVLLRVRLLKYYKANYSELNDFVVEEHDSELRCPDALSSLLDMAFQDDIFKHVHSIEELLHPVNPPTTRITLQLRDEASQLPILRAEYLEGEDWQISPTEPLGYMQYATILKTLSEDAGFQYPVTPYTRGTNDTSTEILTDELQQMMEYTPMSSIFDDAFTSDLGAMLFNRPEYKEDIPDSIKSMSTGHLLDEPKLASLQDAQILDNPEIKTLNIEPL